MRVNTSNFTNAFGAAQIKSEAADGVGLYVDTNGDGAFDKNILEPDTDSGDDTDSETDSPIKVSAANPKNGKTVPGKVFLTNTSAATVTYQIGTAASKSKPKKLKPSKTAAAAAKPGDRLYVNGSAAAVNITFKAKAPNVKVSVVKSETAYTVSFAPGSDKVDLKYLKFSCGLNAPASEWVAPGGSSVTVSANPGERLFLKYDGADYTAVLSGAPANDKSVKKSKKFK